MNKIKSLLFLALIISSVQLYSQTENQKPRKIQPSVVLEDVVFAINVLDKIEINGAEVDAFLTVRNTLQHILLKAQEAGLGATDTVRVKMEVFVAQDLVNLLQRAKFSGINAVKYKRFVDSILNSAKKEQKENSENQK